MWCNHDDQLDDPLVSLRYFSIADCKVSLLDTLDTRDTRDTWSTDGFWQRLEGGSVGGN